MVALDLSTTSNETLGYALLMAGKFNAELLIINVINSRDLNIIRKIASNQFDRSIEAYAEKAEKEYIEREMRERKAGFDHLLEDMNSPKLKLRIIFKIGVPFKEIIAAVEEEAVDLMIVGSKGRSNVSDVFRGSTAEKIQRFCPIPLLTIRPANLA